MRARVYVCMCSLCVRAPTRLTDSRLAPHRLGSLIIADEGGDSVKINRSARAIIIILNIIIINIIIHPPVPALLFFRRGSWIYTEEEEERGADHPSFSWVSSRPLRRPHFP